MQHAVRLGLSILLLTAAHASAQGEGRPSGQGPMRTSAVAERLNAGTVGIITGGVDGTYIRIGADIANVLDGPDLRVLTLVGRGSVQNLRDLMFLRGIDISIVQMDARESLSADNLSAAADRRLRYIAPLYNEEVHVLANRAISGVDQLRGKKVGIDKPGSGTNLTARNIFRKLNIQPEFVEIDQTSSYAALRAGDIAAAVYVAGRPVRAISDFKDEGSVHLLGLPFAGDLAETYLPSRFTKSDYPGLLDDDRPIETLAVGSVLAAFNWQVGSERYRRVERFVNAFFSRFSEFRKAGRHPKWKEVNLSGTVPGWQRFPAAQLWLDRNAPSAPSGLRPAPQASAVQQ